MTGGTGSSGKHLCNVMLEKYHPQTIRVYSRN
ncbi:MAG: polysaccharide biosynthesis protein [Pseudomonadota bacterium]